MERKEEDDKQKEDDKDKKSNDKVKKNLETKKSERKSCESDRDGDGDDDDDKEKKKDRDKKRNRVRLYTKHKQLLLSFVYFDQSHCGYIFDKDIEDLLYNLGLSLSRAQVRKLVGKVITRDSLHYRKLTDKPKDEESPIKEELEDAIVKELAVGNNKILPLFFSEKENDRDLKLEPIKETSTEGKNVFEIFK